VSPKSKQAASKPTPKVATATPVPLRAAQTTSSRKADRSGFSYDDAVVVASGPRPVELNPVDNSPHVATPEGTDLWG
jgi:hypothetical protein